MTNFEKIKSMNLEELTSMLCDLQSALGNCDECIAAKYCSFGHNGMKDLLEREVSAEWLGD